VLKIYLHLTARLPAPEAIKHQANLTSAMAGLTYEWYLYQRQDRLLNSCRMSAGFYNANLNILIYPDLDNPSLKDPKVVMVQTLLRHSKLTALFINLILPFHVIQCYAELLNEGMATCKMEAVKWQP
jgi:hypothetical protein